MQNAKSLLSSNTFQLACLQAAAGVLLIFGTSYPAVGWIALAKSVVDIVIRLRTSQPIGSIT